ncbi:MAG: GNAT family N-acetyltransferase [Bacteroidetes bacterium RIFCSPHIGHO2_02_FULL_44_7]|nr:MAG: GNAT family N-acetyltransferase [Bacteroidetes bacterium RIFCSPHIGHO2_02_FULL_44_7]
MPSNFPSHLVLENDAVLLRPLSLDDFDALLPFSLNEPELWTYSLVPASGSDNLRSYLQKAVEDREAGHSHPFLVIDKASGETAGSTRFYDYHGFHNTVLLGHTWYGKKFQGTGLNKQCKYLLLEYAFSVLQVERVEFRADNQNKRSIAAMKSIGYTVEGILRSNCKSLKGRRDSIVLSILRSEWNSSIRTSLAAKIGM